MKKGTSNVLLAITTVLLLGAIGGGTWYYLNKVKPAEDPKSSEPSEDHSSAGSEVAVIENGIHILSRRISDGEELITYSVTNGSNGDAVLVSSGWTDTTYTAGAVSDYLTVTHDMKGKTVLLYVNKAFPKQISVKLVSANNPDVYAIVKADYKKRVDDYSVDNLIVSEGAKITSSVSTTIGVGTIDLTEEDLAISANVNLVMDTKPARSYIESHSSDYLAEDPTATYERTIVGNSEDVCDAITDSTKVFVPINYPAEVNAINEFEGVTWNRSYITRLKFFYTGDTEFEINLMDLPKSVISECFATANKNGFCQLISSQFMISPSRIYYDVPLGFLSDISAIAVDEATVVF